MLRLLFQLGGDRLVRLLRQERRHPLRVVDLAGELLVGLVNAAQRLEVGYDLLRLLRIFPEARLRHLALELPGARFALLDVKDSSAAGPGSGGRPRAACASPTNPFRPPLSVQVEGPLKPVRPRLSISSQIASARRFSSARSPSFSMRHCRRAPRIGGSF